MILSFLGTGSGVPSTKRNVSAMALSFRKTGKWWLFDCGEGTQHQLLKSPLKISQLEKIFITHLHGDHIFGLLGLLASRSLSARVETRIDVYGPSGLFDYVQAVQAVSPMHIGYPLFFHTIEPGMILDTDEVTVTCAPVQHRVPAFAYAIEEKPVSGAFQAEKAKALGIPPGPLFGALKRGDTVVLEDGRTIEGKTLVGPMQAGRKVVLSGDTMPCEALLQLARDADVLIHESTYAHVHLELAVRSGHSTARQAAEIARAAKVKQLILTHISPRYDDPDGEWTAVQVLDEARQTFPDTELAHDFWQYEVKRPRGILDRDDPNGGTS
ncbi:ribonuclease Z [Brevibacillus fluminis]|uniref:ribonuclease Z n=1 Tax=Brevibacillus fluminis TaxID=511487 RepID=UPI003F8C8A9E